MNIRLIFKILNSLLTGFVYKGTVHILRGLLGKRVMVQSEVTGKTCVLENGREEGSKCGKAHVVYGRSPKKETLRVETVVSFLISIKIRIEYCNRCAYGENIK